MSLYLVLMIGYLIFSKRYVSIEHLNNFGGSNELQVGFEEANDGV